MLIELTQLISLYSDSDPPKLIKKNIRTKLSIYTEDIMGVQEIFNSKGNVIKNRCKVIHRSSSVHIVQGTHKKISGLMKEKPKEKYKEIKGFRK